MKVNLNDTIKVKLTDLGKEIYYHQFDDVNKRGAKIEPKFPNVDEDGMTEKLGVYNVVKTLDYMPMVDACYYNGKDTWYSDNRINEDRILTDEVIAWQPLPEWRG